MSFDLDKIREYFKGDTFAESNNMKIVRVEENLAEVECEIIPNHFNAIGTVQGGLIFTLADYAFAVVTNTNGYSTTSQNMSITYLRPAIMGKLRAIGKIINSSKSMVLADLEVYDDNNKLIAKVQANGFKIKKEGK